MVQDDEMALEDRTSAQAAEPEAEANPRAPGAAVEPEAEAIPREDAAALGLRVEVLAGRALVLSGVKNTVRTMVNIMTPEPLASAQMRAPIRVACVLDRSGSMGGEKLNFAKKAVQKLVKHLDAQDTLHLVTYDHTVQVAFRNGDLSEAGKESLKAAIQAVRTGGTTNLFGGLEAAVQLLGGEAWSGQKEMASPEGDRDVRRIFLFSDGNVNAGMCDKHEIRRAVAAWAGAGITTSTFGIGLDFDEPLMKGIADAGKGRYTYLSKGRDIPKLVSKSVHDLLELYGSEATLDIRGAMHTSVVRVYGADEDDQGSCGTSMPGLLHMGDLHYANKRMALMELEAAPPGYPGDAAHFVAAEWILTFQQAGAQVQLFGELKLQATRDRGALGEESKAVRAAFAVSQAADWELEVADLLSHGDRARARDAKARQIEFLKETIEAVGASEAAMLIQVLERAERVSEQLEGSECSEAVRRQCVQEVQLGRAMSACGFEDRCDSSPGGSEHSGGDVGNLGDFDDLNSPRGSVGSVCSQTPPGSPRLGRCLSRSGSSATGSTDGGSSPPVPAPPPAARSQSTSLLGSIKRRLLGR
jgi:Ca-activated chloride channel family protein